MNTHKVTLESKIDATTYVTHEAEFIVETTQDAEDAGRTMLQHIKAFNEGFAESAPS